MYHFQNQRYIYEDKIVLVYGDDGIRKDDLATHGFVHKNWVKVLGHVQPTFFHADWTDHWNQTLASKVGRGVLIKDRDRLFLRHLHAELGGMEKDDTYWRMKARRERNVSEGLSFHNPTPEMVKDFNEQLSKLVKYIKEFKNEN